MIGSPGEPAFEARFHGWAERLSRVLVQDIGFTADRVGRYPESATEPPLTREAVKSTLAAAGTRLSPEDRLVVLLIGHGTDQGAPKFLLDGPDLLAGDLRTWLDAIISGAQLIINTTSASGGFVNALAAQNRVVCTSTQSGTERNATEFMEHLVVALEQGRGDVDRNGRLAWGEWLDAAAKGTASWYESEGYIPTEHALLDDNGDGHGTGLPLSDRDGEGVFDGHLAAREFLDATPDHGVGGQTAYGKALAAVQAWKTSKGTVAESEYWDTLERLLLDAARLYPENR